MNAEQWTTTLFSSLMVLVVVWRTWATYRKQGTERGQTTMLWSFYALYAMSGVVFVGAALEFYLLHRPRRLGLVVAGLVLYGLSHWLRAAAVRALGRYWSLHIEIRKQHPLVQTGPYRWVRHPAYAAFVIEHIAVPLAGGAWWSLVVALLGYVPLLLWRIRREESALMLQLGQPYVTYRQQVGMLVPRALPAKSSCSSVRADS